MNAAEVLQKLRELQVVHVIGEGYVVPVSISSTGDKEVLGTASEGGELFKIVHSGKMQQWRNGFLAVEYRDVCTLIRQVEGNSQEKIGVLPVWFSKMGRAAFIARALAAAGYQVLWEPEWPDRLCTSIDWREFWTFCEENQGTISAELMAEMTTIDTFTKKN